MRRATIRPVSLALLALLWCPITRAEDPPKSESQDAKAKPKVERRKLSDEDRQKNIESFDKVWTTILDKHFDPKLNGLDWDAIRTELRPKVEKAEYQGEARAVMNDMIGRLKQSHFGILPADIYGEIQGDKKDKPSGGPGSVGMTVRVEGNDALVVSLEDDMAAAQAGVRTGWKVQSIDGEAIGPILEKVRERIKKEAKAQPYLLTLVAEQRLRGEVGSKVEIEFLDADDKPVKKTLERTRPPGEMRAFGNLPAMRVHFVAKRIGDPKTIQYFALTTFFDPARVLKTLQDTVTANQDAEGMILDLRGNPGGMGGMAMGFGGWFVTKPDLQLGTMITRTGKLNFTLNPRSASYAGPLAILVDELSMSTSEILAGGLQDIGRAKVFGRKTPGAALPSVIERLPNGDGFQYAFANYISSGGQPLEGRGVIPDVPVSLDRKALLDGQDPDIAAAVAWIRSQPRRESAGGGGQQ